MGRVPLLVGTGSYHCKILYFSVTLCPHCHIISLFTAGTLTGFDASGHIAEETKNAR
jgi:translation initiation factor 5B